LRRPVLLSLIAVVSASRSSSAEPAGFATGEIGLGGGYDDNMFLQISPDAALREPLVSGAFAHVAPRVGAGLAAGGWRLDLGYLLDYRGSDAAGHLAFQEAELAVAFPSLWRLRPTLTGKVGRFDASRYDTDRFTLVGGGIELRLALTETLRVIGGYQLERRTFPNRASEHDNVHLGELRFSWRPEPLLEVGVGSSYLAVAPAHAALMDDGTVRSLRFGPDGQLVWKRMSLGLSLWAGNITVPGRTEWQVGGGAGLVVRLFENVDLAASFEVSRAPWTDAASAQIYERSAFVLGIVGHVSGRVSLGGRREVDEQRPLVQAGRVRFRLKATAAVSVAVIGSWNDWASPGVELTHSGPPGMWEGWVDVPPGTYRYHMIVDGQPVRPPDAVRYEADDFGSEDGIVEIRGEGS
jgi:hypothetical protein